MRVVQMLPILAFGDAIGNNALVIDRILRENGFDTDIYAQIIDRRLSDSGAHSIADYVDSKDTLILYHLSTGETLNDTVRAFAARIALIYHNITPGHFFMDYDPGALARCNRGIRSAKRLAERVEFAIADSEFNKQCLIEMGYTCPIEVVPILVAFSDYENEPDAEIMRRYGGVYDDNSGRFRDCYNNNIYNIIFTGRLAPNKKQEDIIAAFAVYHENINPKSRLILVGHGNDGAYEYALKDYVKRLGITDVIFTGQVPFSHILAYYKVADVFLCLSEHEGFCVPLLEAMFFDVPIIAYDSTAVGDTLGGAGLLLEDKDPRVVAEAIELVRTDERLRNRMIESGRMRLLQFSHEVVGEKLLNVIRDNL